LESNLCRLDSQRASSPRIIIHVDVDAFFAAVEEREHPTFKGKPVVVGADPKGGSGRGVVSTCNYEARKFGIYSGMPILIAWAHCKDAIFLPVNYPLYREVSFKIMKILKGHADKFQKTSIDEAFLDVSERVINYFKAEQLARRIKREIKRAEELTCSIGIAPNKLVAKIASDFQKPNGLTIVEQNNITQFLSPLQVDKIWGIGQKTKAKLKPMGIETIGELASYDSTKLKKKFGTLGFAFHQMAQGIDHSEVVEKRIPKSFSHEQTFDTNVSDAKLIQMKVDKLLEEVIKDVERHEFTFKTLTLKVRYDNFETHTHSTTLPFPAIKPKTFKEIAHKLLFPSLQSGKAIRLVGIKA
jgi:DNA polymerase IV (DinB-like DNA polymerase)